jgi:hypothetical protein
MFDIEKFAEESAIQAVKIGEMQKLIKYAADPPKEPEKIRVLTRDVPWQRIGTGAAIGAGAGGILSVLRDLLTGKSVSARRAIITSLLGGIAGGSIPYGIHALDPSRDRFQETLDDLTGDGEPKKSKPDLSKLNVPEDTPSSDPEVEKLRVAIRKSLEERVEKLDTLPPDSPEAKRIRKENTQLVQHLNTLKGVKDPWARSQIIRSVATILGGEVAIKGIVDPLITKPFSQWIQRPGDASPTMTGAVLKHLVNKVQIGDVPVEPGSVIELIKLNQTKSPYNVASVESTFARAANSLSPAKRQIYEQIPPRSRKKRLKFLVDQGAIKNFGTVSSDAIGYESAKRTIGNTHRSFRPASKSDLKAERAAKNQMKEIQKRQGFDPNTVERPSVIGKATTKTLGALGRLLPHALLFGYEGLRNYKRVTALEESNKARLNEVGSAIK